MMWTSQTCLVKGSDQGIDALPVRVRVGLITRTEVIPLGMGWFLSGPSQPPSGPNATTCLGVPRALAQLATGHEHPRPSRTCRYLPARR